MHRNVPTIYANVRTESVSYKDVNLSQFLKYLQKEVGQVLQVDRGVFVEEQYV